MGKCGLFFTSYAAEAGLFPTTFQRTWLAALLLALACAPLVLSTYLVSVGNLILIAVIGAVGLNILTGACGQISLGHGAFIGVGAYAAGLATTHGLPFPVALVLGGLASAVVGMVFGIPSLRLKGIYLAIATLAAQLVLEYVFLHWSAVTGGSNGMLLDAPTILGVAFDTDQKMYYLILAVTVLCLTGAANLMRTRFGRAFVAIRDFHLSAEIAGVSLFRYKLFAFGASSFLAGVAGCLWGHYTMYVTAEQFNIALSVSYLAMIIIGGLGSVLGAILGAVFITVLPEALNLLAAALSGWFPDVSSSITALREGVFGLALVLFLIFEPEGLVHRWRLIRAYWKLYPFAH
ncbi:MAG: branched-chain amino acid ABC transporter permease [Desulfovibrionaceae bacterium]|jgi:branched-chain amino acid transport system permease protein|nr:branched-chain amino acid ABC transporter permease [Desulfovibrionaceae bacterium]